MVGAPHDDHVGLRAGYRPDGSPFIELVPARRLDEGLYEVLGTPGIAKGCAQGDQIAVDAEGGFEVKARGGNVAVHVYCGGTIPVDDVIELRRRFSGIGGIVEAPELARFAVVTVPVAAGFVAIEDAVQGWVASRSNVEWNFGNIYDDDGQPLDWWEVST